MPEIIELLSSPKPEPRKRSSARVAERVGTKRSRDADGERSDGVGKATKVRDEVSGKESGQGQGQEQEQEKEKSEVQKIRELRLRRFGFSGTAASSPAEKEKTIPPAGNTNEDNPAKSEGAYNTTTNHSLTTQDIGLPKTAMGPHQGTMANTPISKAIVITLDDDYDDDCDGFRMPLSDKNEIGDIQKAPALGTARVGHGENSHIDPAAYSDPFRSSSPPPDVSKDPKAQPNKTVSGRTSIIPYDFNEDDFSFNDTYDMEVPVAKRPRLLPKPATITSARTMTKKSGGLRRAISNTEKNSHTFQPKGSRLRRTKTMDSDPIVFTSSPDTSDYKHKKTVKHKGQAEKSDDGFVDIDDLPSASHKTFPGALARRSNPKDSDIIVSDDGNSDDDSDDLPEILAPFPPAAKPKSTKAALAAWGKEKKAGKQAQEKADKAAAKKAASEEAKKRKRVEKEKKVREKERQAALAKANTLRTNKRTSTPEMIVDLPNGMDVRLVEHTRVLLEGLNVEVGEWDAPVANVIRWRRKAQNEWNDELGCWTPVTEHIKKEEHVLVIIKAQEFLNLINGKEGKDLVCHILEIKGTFEDNSTGRKKIIYLIEGLTALLNKNRNAKSRKYVQAVRNADEAAVGATATAAAASYKKGKAKTDELKDIDKEAVEDALLKLQVLHNVLVYHTGALAETAQWITVFTQHISTIPYKHQKLALDTTFCMDSGHRTKGTDPEDTFIKMLQETSRLTAAIAHGIASEYPTAKKLVNAFEKAGPNAPLLLKDLKKSAGSNGAFSDRNIGPALSKRVWQVFMGKDEMSTDI